MPLPLAFRNRQYSLALGEDARESHKAKLLVVAGTAVLAGVTLIMALRGERGMWFSFAAMVMALGLAWVVSRSNRST